MGKLTKKALLKHLTKSDKEDIIREVLILFDKFKNVKEFYQAELSGGENPTLEKYKKLIAKAYNNPNPKERTTNLNINKLITGFKKISIYDREVADLMLYRVECGLKAIKRDSNRSATFYNCILVTFEDAIKLIAADHTIDDFRERIDNILRMKIKTKYEMMERMNKVEV